MSPDTFWTRSLTWLIFHSFDKLVHLLHLHTSFYKKNITNQTKPNISIY